MNSTAIIKGIELTDFIVFSEYGELSTKLPVIATSPHTTEAVGSGKQKACQHLLRHTLAV
jgi:hypothetical protein